MRLAEDLKKAVFQSAMMGQLTERIKEYTPVEDLIASIEEEKKKGVKNKEVKKDKTLFPDMPEEVPFDIPDTWKWVKLGSICKKIGAGSTPKGGKAVYLSTGIIFIREQNVYNNGLRLEDVVYISNSIHASMKNSEVHAQDILMNITGASIGRTALVNNNFDKANINQHVLIIRLVDLRMKDYIHHCLCSPLIIDQMMKNQKGDKPGLSAQRVGNFMIPIPPIEEQQAIVAKLNVIEKAIDEFAEIESQLNQIQAKFPFDMEKSILQYALQGKITKQLDSDSDVSLYLEENRRKREKLIKEKKVKREKYTFYLTEEETPYDIPDTWKWVKLMEICNLVSGSDMTTAEYNQNKKGIPYLTGASNIEDGEIIINRWTETPKSVALKGDLLLTCKGTVGKMAFLHEDKVHIARQIMAIQPYSNINRQYLYYCILNYVLYLKSKAKSMIPGIDRELVLNLPIPLPPVEEQQRIVEKLTKILLLCNDLKV